MNGPPSIPTRRGFTLIEVLAALGLCALLTAASAAAIAFSVRAERLAARDGEAALLLPALYAAQRLRPDEVYSPPAGWRIVPSSEIVALSDGGFREWHLAAIASPGSEIEPFAVRILEDAP